jgi:hypothetical protein
VAGGGHEAELAEVFARNRLSETLPLALFDSLAFGSSYLLCWADENGYPRVSAESPWEMVTADDPVTRKPLAALKRFHDGERFRGILFEPDKVRFLRSDPVPIEVGDAFPATLRTTSVVPNPFGRVPVAHLAHRTGSGPPVSAIEELLPLQLALDKTLSDVLTVSEAFAWPKRYVTGLESIPIDEDGNRLNPLADAGRMDVLAIEGDAKAGQWPASDMAGLLDSMKLLTSQLLSLASVSAHLAHGSAASGQPLSSDSIYAHESALTHRIKGFQRLYSAPIASTLRRSLEVIHGHRPDNGHEIQVRWSPPGTRSVPADADAYVKLVGAGMAAPEARDLLGWS